MKRCTRQTLVPLVLSATLLVACQDLREPTAPEHPLAEVADGGSLGSSPNFSFLPPLVAAPGVSGAFDATQNPTVLVCELQGDACGRYVAGFGRTFGANRITVDIAAEAYQVLWNTGAFDLDAAKNYRLRVYARGREVGHIDLDVVESEDEAAAVDRTQFAPVVLGDALSIRFRFMMDGESAPAPAPLVSLAAGGATQEIWPYTGTNFSGAPQDPTNLIFVGASDPRSIRAALLQLSGDRTAFGFPSVFPFNCTWKDAIGGDQTAFSEIAEWEGSVIQLECGEYTSIRFHIRLFRAGSWTIANAHVDVLIPGTTDHQVISWEVGEQVVTADLVRSGLLAASPAQTGSINAAPFREIPAIIYNGLPLPLKQLAGGPLGPVTGPVPIQTDGRATILNLARPVEAEPGTATQAFTIQFNQVIPKPFCNDGDDFVLVQGPIELSQDVNVSPSGNLVRQVLARGDLTVTPFDPISRIPLGEPQSATTRDHYHAQITDRITAVANSRVQRLRTPDGLERLLVDLQVGPNGVTRFRREEDCGQ